MNSPDTSQNYLQQQSTEGAEFLNSFYETTKFFFSSRNLWNTPVLCFSSETSFVK